MAGTIVNAVLKPEMPRSEVENLLGVAHDYSDEDSINEYTYFLGTCRLVMDDDFLVVEYNKDNKLTKAYNEQR